ncbi:hypothetical protein [Iodobacter fluviatilis]|uniref:Uncharacterized protein n=1 Tax=Iodobacter fluviatilis TaxID=537 RepID=A0A377QC02_9NEIS|nr:hypothetical protein [Iodobacter fluviatilis]TCU88538.1 hypothetical protein EV682_103122 [Iodobacter fluviatilis]STQ91391.1 Uncharacterised protein [Iodobacter fluviatilis]
MFFKKKTPPHPYDHTDFGRVFGWWLCLDGERIADVNYWAYGVSSQFWHEYKVFPFNAKFNDIGFDPDNWSLDGIALESRFAEGYYIKDFIIHSVRDNLIMIRNAHVPKEQFISAMNSSNHS